MTDEQLELLTPSLIQDFPNTYTWTKSLAECLLQNEAKDLPVSILRPSIVGAAYKEPLPVWQTDITIRIVIYIYTCIYILYIYIYIMMIPLN